MEKKRVGEGNIGSQNFYSSTDIVQESVYSVSTDTWIVMNF